MADENINSAQAENEAPAENAENKAVTGADESVGGNTFKRVYDDTTYFIDSIMSEYDVFPTILSMMREGDASIELRKRYLLRAIDETWVNIIEDTLPALDTVIRNPSKFIEEKEEVMPIELTRNISVRSLQHLSQHTNFISKIEGDKITPSKILNVFREETLQTYENKFINTLINRLFVFVNRRYEIAKQSGQDEKTTALDFKEDFEHQKVKVKMHFHVEIAESATDEADRVERNYTYTTDLWHRVERLNKIVTAYLESEFVHNMGQSYIHPPVMRTNAILKNKNLRQCLALWQFIEGYDNAGYSMLVQEDLEKVDDVYVKELYSTLALQYLIFRYNIRNEFDADKTITSEMSEGELKPRIVDELKSTEEDEFDIPETIDERTPEMPSMTRYGTLTPEDKLMLTSIDIAMDAADKIRENEIDELFSSGAIEEPEPTPLREEDPPEPAGEEEENPDTPPAAETSAATAAADIGPAEDFVPAAPEKRKVIPRVAQKGAPKTLKIKAVIAQKAEEKQAKEKTPVHVKVKKSLNTPPSLKVSVKTEDKEPDAED